MIGPGVVVGVEVEIPIRVHLLSVDFNLSPSLMTLASRKAPLLTQLALFGYGKAGRAWYLFSREHDEIGKW